MNIKSQSKKRLRIGFLPLTDAAPLVVALEKGLFARHGIDVELCREVGWATIREKIIYGELEAAQAPAPMLWSTRTGSDSVACPVLTGFVLNLNGNALTFSDRLWQEGVRDASTLREAARRRSGERKLTFGVVFQYSSHHTLLRGWLKKAGINPDKDVRIVVVPPAQMVRNLAAGTIDGFCAGEPYGSVAVEQGVGWIAAASSSLQPDWVEKVLMVTERFAFERTAEHHGLINSLLEACAWCDEPSHRDELLSLLAMPKYVNQSPALLSRALHGELNAGYGRTISAPDCITFYRGDANVPTLARATALQKDLVEARLLTTDLDRDLCHRLFREDIFRQALTQANHVSLTH